MASDSYVAFTAAEFRVYPFPPIEQVLEPWLKARGIVMIAGYRGIGKTFFSLSTAAAIASAGGFLGFRAPTARSVLYVDGEMDPGETQQRMKAIEAGMFGSNPAYEGNFRYTTYALQDGGFMNLCEPKGQRRMEATLGESEVLFLDNIFTLCRPLNGSTHNDAESWLDMQEWLLRLRAKGKTVVLIHHTGKPDKESGQTSQFGTSMREVILDATLLLERLPMRQKGMKIVAEKARGFEAWDPAIKAKVVWTDAPVGPCTLERLDSADIADKVAELREEGLPDAEIAKRLRMNLRTMGGL